MHRGDTYKKRISSARQPGILFPRKQDIQLSRFPDIPCFYPAFASLLAIWLNNEPVQAKRYGEEFCKLIKRHCEENEIERPEDLRVRTVANKSKMKVAIIQAIDRKVALDDIAMSKGIEFEELLDEIEAIVYSGTKLNIDYFLEDIMDEDHLLDIYDYFKESTTDNIDDALDELGDDFTEEEVRLVRIKFISEMAN